MTRKTATEIESEIGATSVVVDHKRRIYWVPEDRSEYPDVADYEFTKQDDGEF